jgi:hypothetical protein
VIRVYDEAGNVIETHEQAASLKSGSAIKMFAATGSVGYVKMNVATK